MSNLEKMSLKAFWEAVEERLAACSVDELCAILRAMARDTLPAERRAFLAKLKRVDETHDAVRQALRQEELLDEAGDLAQELEGAMAESEYWEEHYDWDEYDEEDALGPYKEFVDPLSRLFDRAEAVFDYGNLSLAREAYQKLFQVLDLEDEYGRRVSMSDLSDVDPGEARARYLRAVYETEPPERRPQALFAQMRGMRLALMRPRPMLDDLIQISPRPLPDREPFLADWIAFLRTESGSEADAWLREAVRLLQGLPGLETLARTDGQAHPRAYLDWFTALEQEDRHPEVLAAAQEALHVLPTELPIRAAIADHLGAAAAKLNDQHTLRAGRWEAFLVNPTLTRLLDLWDVVPAGKEQTALMHRAAQHMRDYRVQQSSRPIEVGWGGDGLERAVSVGDSVLAHACLLGQEFEAARQLVTGEHVLGWSRISSAQGLVVGFFLVLLSGRAPGTLPPNLAQVWQWRLEYSTDSWYGMEKNPVCRRLERAYADLLATASLSGNRQKSVLSWCLDVAQRRVDAIVGGQKRKSYDKAAILTVACAETLRLRGDAQAAGLLVDEIRNRFPRHRNFQAELGAALQRTER